MSRVKVFETPIVELEPRSMPPIAMRRCSSSEVPPSSFKPGLYTCQVSVIDTVSGRFAFPRLQMCVR